MSLGENSDREVLELSGKSYTGLTGTQWACKVVNKEKVFKIVFPSLLMNETLKCLPCYNNFFCTLN